MEKYDLNLKEKLEFNKKSYCFYKEKTFIRIDKFFKKFSRKDSELVINGLKTPKVVDLLNEVDWDYISSGIPVRFHGDFHFENIIYDRLEDKFFFLDWRQDFGGIFNYGDLYYDLAKLIMG